jgi:hypothetical protein
MGTWRALREQTLKQMALEPPATLPAAGTMLNPLMVLDPQSLQNLQQAVEKKALKVTREKSELVLTLPLTAKDADGFAGMYKSMVARAQQLAATPETEENREKLGQMRAMAAAGGVFQVEGGDKGLRATMDLVALSKALTALPAERTDMNDKGQAKAPVDVVAALKAKGIPVNGTLTAEAVVKAFNEGTLKGKPSEKPVTPGEGIVK